MCANNLYLASLIAPILALIPALILDFAWAVLAILLALGRRSKLPIISNLSIAYIELIRGVPLITTLSGALLTVPSLTISWAV